jgi:hypothetical protein
MQQRARKSGGGASGAPACAAPRGAAGPHWHCRPPAARRARRTGSGMLCCGPERPSAAISRGERPNSGRRARCCCSSAAPASSGAAEGSSSRRPGANHSYWSESWLVRRKNSASPSLYSADGPNTFQLFATATARRRGVPGPPGCERAGAGWIALLPGPRARRAPACRPAGTRCCSCIVARAPRRTRCVAGCAGLLHLRSRGCDAHTRGADRPKQRGGERVEAAATAMRARVGRPWLGLTGGAGGAAAGDQLPRRPRRAPRAATRRPPCRAPALPPPLATDAPCRCSAPTAAGPHLPARPGL